MKHSYAGFAAAAAIAAITVACGNQETQVIENFFRAVQAKDNQTVSSFSLVQFDLDVTSWKVQSIGEEQRVPAPLGSLAGVLAVADEAATQNKKDASAYFNAHPLEVDQVKPLVENDKPVPRNLQKTADDWRQFNDADKDLKAKAADARQAYEREKRIVVMSTGQAGSPDALVGDLVNKTAVVEVEADGDVKTYAIKLRQYDVAPGGEGVKKSSRWLVESITPQ